MIALTVPGEPRPMARPRVLKTGRTYTPPESEAHKRLVAFHVRKAMMLRARGVFPMRGPISVKLDFFLSNRRRVDVDNLAKMVMDALTLARVWSDDSQVVALATHKYAPSSSPRTWITVEMVQATTQPAAVSYGPGVDPIEGERLRPMHSGRDMSGNGEG